MPASLIAIHFVGFPVTGPEESVGTLAVLPAVSAACVLSNDAPPANCNVPSTYAPPDVCKLHLLVIVTFEPTVGVLSRYSVEAFV